MRITPAMLVLGLFDKAERPLPSAAGPVSDGYGDYDAAASKGLAVTLYNDAACTGGKFEGWYVEGVCYSTQGNHGMHVQNTRHNGCSLTVYSGGGCSGGSANLDQRKCWNVVGRGSFKIFC